jgi:predicted transcriptional regulator
MENDKKTVSFRLDAEKLAALDELAKVQARDRTYLLSQAVDAYLEVQRWQIEHIKESIRQADAGMGVPHRKVVAKWRRRLQCPYRAFARSSVAIRRSAPDASQPD